MLLGAVEPAESKGGPRRPPRLHSFELELSRSARSHGGALVYQAVPSTVPACSVATWTDELDSTPESRSRSLISKGI